MGGQALYYGMNALSHNVIMADRKKLKSANGMYLGSTGSGKSFAAKRELINVFLATSDRIVIVDPMGEYSPLVRRLGGQVIEIAPERSFWPEISGLHERRRRFCPRCQRKASRKVASGQKSAIRTGGHEKAGRQGGLASRAG